MRNGDQELPEKVGTSLDIGESLHGGVLLKAQIMTFRVEGVDVRIEIDISSVNRMLPVRLFIDAGNPVRITFPEIGFLTPPVFPGKPAEANPPSAPQTP
jgi:hypothetical protein